MTYPRPSASDTMDAPGLSGPEVIDALADGLEAGPQTWEGFLADVGAGTITLRPVSGVTLTTVSAAGATITAREVSGVTLTTVNAVGSSITTRPTLGATIVPIAAGSTPTEGPHMSKSNATETDLLNLVFKATALPWAAVVNLEVHLHTADPGEAGISTTSEATYTSYAAVTVARSGVGWTVVGDSATNAALIQFPQCTGGTNTITHVSVTPASSTQILYSGALSSSLAVSNGIQPQFAAASMTITEN